MWEMRWGYVVTVGRNVLRKPTVRGAVRSMTGPLYAPVGCGLRMRLGKGETWTIVGDTECLWVWESSKTECSRHYSWAASVVQLALFKSDVGVILPSVCMYLQCDCEQLENEERGLLEKAIPWPSFWHGSKHTKLFTQKHSNVDCLKMPHMSRVPEQIFEHPLKFSPVIFI